LIPGSGLTASSVTWTVTAAAKTPVNAAVAHGSTPILAPANNALGDTNAVLAKASAGTIVANIEFDETNGISSGAGVLTNADSKLLTVSVSGPGLASFVYTGVGATVLNPSKYITEDGKTDGTGNTFSGSNACGWSCGAIGSGNLHKIVYIWGDGTAGTATVTVSAGGVTLLTKPVIFYTAATKVTATQAVKILTSGANYSGGKTATTYAVQLAATDKNSNKSVLDPANVSVTATDSTVVDAVDCATDGTDAALVDCRIHTLATATSGKTVGLVFNYTNTDATVVSASSLSFKVADATATSYVVALDSDSYIPGQQATVTLTGLDASNNPVADSASIGAGTLSATSALSSTGTFAGSNKAVTAGTGSIKFNINMPVTPSDVTVTFTDSGAVSASAKATVGVGAVGEAAQAAIDAAQEATDAANAAYDAANNAMDSADAATAAAQDASDNASAALAAVTDLAATVAKLVASVNAIASALAKLQAVQAKIQKKLKA